MKNTRCDLTRLVSLIEDLESASTNNEMFMEGRLTVTHGEDRPLGTLVFDGTDGVTWEQQW